MLNIGYIDSQIKAMILNGLHLNSTQVVKYDEYGHYNVHHDGQPIASHSHLNCCHLNVTKVPSCRLCRWAHSFLFTDLIEVLMYMSPEYIKRIKPHSEMASYLVVWCLPLNTVLTLFFSIRMLFFWTRLNILISLSILDWKYSWIILNDKLWVYGISALECIGVSGNYQCSCRSVKEGIFLWLSFKRKLYCIYRFSAQNWALF